MKFDILLLFFYFFYLSFKIQYKNAFLYLNIEFKQFLHRILAAFGCLYSKKLIYKLKILVEINN